MKRQARSWPPTAPHTFRRWPRCAAPSRKRLANPQVCQANRQHPVEKAMRDMLETVLPRRIDNTIRGTTLSFYVFAWYAIVSTVRSCIRLLSPDGGAGSIAGMDLSVAGADMIIFAFAL